MKVASELVFDSSLTTGIYKTDTYDSSKLMFGDLFKLDTTNKLAGPKQINWIRIGELCGFGVAYPHVINWSPTINWVFLFDIATAAVTRRIVMLIHDTVNDTLAYRGFITAAWITNTGNKTIRGGRALRYVHNSGTVEVSGNAVTGDGTSWLTDRIAQGCRIGFGTTDPTQVSIWYDIATINSDSSITLLGGPGTLPAGASYVIEELRIAMAITNATVANGGLFLIKGLSPHQFVIGGTTIPEAHLTNNPGLQAIYWLKDATVVNNIAASGLGIEPAFTSGSHMAYIVNADLTARATIFKYNLRDALSGPTLGPISGSFTTSAFVLRTQQATLTASHVVSQTNNGRVFNVSSGIASGSQSLWFTSNATNTSRINRCPINDIVSGSTSFVADTMVENPPGGTSTIPVTNSLAAPDYSSSIDRIIISTGVAPFRIFSTAYNTGGEQFGDTFLADTGALNQYTSQVDAPFYPSPRAVVTSIWTDTGFIYIIANSATTTLNALYVIPLAADWKYTDSTDQVMITPAIPTTNASKLYRVGINATQLYGGSQSLAVQTEPWRVYARTSGISDDSGSWTLIEADGDLSGFGIGSEIQFKFEFRIMGIFTAASQIANLVVVYENDSQDSHYQPTLSLSSTSDRTFAWKQVSLFSGSIPDLRVRMYNADLDTLILNDTVNTGVSGSWQYSVNSGSSWNSWDATKNSVGNYIRYTAISIPNNITVRVLLTQV
jgi:hypothetical protein